MPKKQNSGYAHKPVDNTNALMMEFEESRAGGKIEGAVLFVDRARNTLVEKREGALDRGDMDRQIDRFRTRTLLLSKESPAGRGNTISARQPYHLNW